MSSLAVLFATILAQSATSPVPQPQRETAQPASRTSTSIFSELMVKLAKAKRIFVDDFGDSSASKTLRSMIIDAVQKSNRLGDHLKSGQ